MKDYPSPEVYFAQHLASNDTKIRNRAVKKLRSWLMFRSNGSVDFTENDMMKLWKGLYYCMWMCDKPLNQENLADTISEFVHCFSNPTLCMRFIDTFFQSMSKEWHGIDRYRIEKFMLLIRRFLFQCFSVLSKNGWNLKLTAKLLKVLQKHVLNPTSDATPKGLKMHIMDIYLDELAKAGGCDLKPKKFLRFLKPYIAFLIVCDDTLQLNAVVKEVFHALVWQNFNDDDDDDQDDEPTVSFQVDFDGVANLLLKHVSSEEQTLMSKNQKIVYKLIAQLRTASRGQFPFKNVESDDDNEDHKLKKTDISRATKELLDADRKIKEERRERLREMRLKRKNKSKKKDNDSDSESLEECPISLLDNFKESEPRKKRKKRSKPMGGNPKPRKGMKKVL